ncbi:MAG: hypothetical protein HETSPECPRED_004344 [Heterodermia speciosa]|uniref:HotDog ACOT-type domain-containing protein n=1 Tax=Heterodermia speciosa TaxID=116794 RepID=A0A8H3F7D5_9LECA|nr:MAG: hypothetical protein HETSPECPRED_004344 [Heterodermia speciosa]
MRSSRCLRLFENIYASRWITSSRITTRELHKTAVRQTDGVYTALTEMRVKTPWIEALRKQQKDGIDPRKKSDQHATPSDRDLTPKKMSDSYHRVVIPLAQDPWLNDNYLNANGHIRLGTIFMDLDALSGVIAYKHTGESVTTVTAAVDRITINHPLKEICDLELSGQVTFATGRSSMEISLQVAKAPKEGSQVQKEDVLMTCAFTMVSLDPSTKKSVKISPVLVESEEERRLFALGEKNSNAKKALAKTALRKQTPNDEESDLIHAMWLRQLEYHDPNNPIRKPDNVVYMESTRMHSSQIMQPQYRNRHNFMIFGGFLLKQTFELAFCCAAAFSHSRPTFVSLDPSTFENPVPVGSVLYLTATVAYTDPPLVTTPDDVHRTSDVGSNLQDEASDSNYTRVQIRIDSKVRNIEHGETKPTGQFNYTFLVAQDIKIMPKTYSEFMIWVDAKRRAERVSASIRGMEASDGRAQAPDDGKIDRITE